MSRWDWPAWARPTDVVDLLRLASPIAVSRASMMLMGLTDTIVLSRNAPEELPYILNSWLPLGICLGVAIGLLLGVSILTAEMAGRGEQEDTGRIFRRGVWLSLFFGGIATVVVYFGAGPLFQALRFEGALLAGVTSASEIMAYGIAAHMLSTAAGNYLEALRRPIFVSVVMYFGVVVNLGFDLAFVSGFWGMPQLGADGVAIATSGTRWFITALLFVAVFLATPGFKRSKPAPKGEARHQIELGYGMAASSIAEWGAFNFTFVIATWISLVAGTLYGMVIHTIGFVFMAFLGIGTATSVRVAEALGRNESQNAQNAARLGVVTSILVGAMCALVMYFGSDGVANVFVSPDEVLNAVQLHPALSGLVAFSAMVVIFDGLQNVASMASRALGAVWSPSVVHITSYIFIMLPLAWYFGLHLEQGVAGVVMGVLIASCLAGITQVILLEYLSRKKVAAS